MNSSSYKYSRIQSIWWVAIIAFLWLSVQEASSQWQRIPSPPGASITSLSVEGKRVIAGTPEGIFISQDSGCTWQPSNSGLPTYNIRAIASNGDRVIMYGDICTLISSDDGGASWIDMGNYFQAATIYFLSSEGATFYVGTNQGLFRSTDNGYHWSKWNGGLTVPTLDGVPQFRSFAGSGNRLYAGVYRLGLYASINGGASWLPRNTDGIPTFVKIAVDGACVYVADDAGNIWVSTDEGYTWRFIRKVSNLVSIVASQSHLYIVSDGQGILHSVDRGYTLTSMNEGLPTTMVTCLTFVGSDILVGLESKGVYRLKGRTGTWIPSLSGICGIDIASLAVLGSSIHIGTGQGVFRTTNLGETWTGTSFGYTGVAFSFFTTIGSTLYTSSAFSGLLRSTDDGATWQQFGAELWSGGVSSLSRLGNYFIAAGWLGCYRSSDEGKTWTESNEGLVQRSGNFNLYDLAYTRSRIVAVGFSGVFASNDSGRTWARSDSGFPGNGAYATTVKVIGNRLLAVCGGQGVFTSTDEGQSWGPSNNGLKTSYVRCILIEKGDVYIGTDLGGVYCSSDSGSTWRFVGDGLPPFMIQSLASDGVNLYISQGGVGLRYRPLAQMHVATAILPEGSRNFPQRFLLSQNYPNPFNPSTTISYWLPRTTSVSLKIFNALGQEIALLVNEQASEGVHQVRWNASVPSGIYFYRLQAGGDIETKKMILLK